MIVERLSDCGLLLTDTEVKAVAQGLPGGVAEGGPASLPVEVAGSPCARSIAARVRGVRKPPGARAVKSARCRARTV